MGGESFQGRRILALENRRAEEIAKLIRGQGGEPTVVPAMREVGLDSNQEALNFTGELLAGKFDAVLFLTGVGARKWLEIAGARFPRKEVLEALGKVKVAARGPKPGAVLRELGIPVAVSAPEPSTWREVVTALDKHFAESLRGLRMAIQEYGVPNPELIDALRLRGVLARTVPIYHWALPEDLEPLRETIRSLIRGEFDAILFLTSVQAAHLFEVAKQMAVEQDLRESLQKMAVLSIGPSTTEELVRDGIPPDLEATHPKMGFFIHEAAVHLNRVLSSKPARSLSMASGSRNAEGKDGKKENVKETAIEPEGHTPANQGDAIELVHQVGREMAAADPLHSVLNRILSFIETLLQSDSCFLYVLEGDELVLRASKNPHPQEIDRLGMHLGEGITGWVAEHREAVVIDSGALHDARFQFVRSLPEDSFEAFLSVPIMARGRVVGVINVQHRQAHHYTPWEVQTIATAGFLVGAEIEAARLEIERNELSSLLDARKLIDRARGLLQRELGVGEREAYELLEKESVLRGKTLREISEAVILSEELRKAAAQRAK